VRTAAAAASPRRHSSLRKLRHSTPKAYVSHVAADVSALTCWSEGKSGYDVITTLQTKQDSNGVVRFVSTLLPGQSQIIAIPGPVNAPARTLMSRIGDRIEITAPPRVSPE